MSSPVVVEEGGETMGGGSGESGERSEVYARSSLTFPARSSLTNPEGFLGHGLG